MLTWLLLRTLNGANRSESSGKLLGNQFRPPGRSTPATPTLQLLLMIDRTAAIGRSQPLESSYSDLLALEFFRPAPLLVAHQDPSRLVPVSQHPALTDSAV